MKPAYRRILLKLSGEVLQGGAKSGIDDRYLRTLCEEIKEVHKLGVQIAIVIGGGNFWRYRDHEKANYDRVVSDNVGILATMMNSLAMASMFQNVGVEARSLSALECSKAIENYVPARALNHLKKGRIVICAGGTGNPFFTTDSAAALRALELQADAFLKATKVDYVYNKDPMKYKDAKKFTDMNYAEVLALGPGIMDLSALTLCQEGRIPIRVFNLQKKGNIKKVVLGQTVGTTIH